MSGRGLARLVPLALVLAGSLSACGDDADPSTGSPAARESPSSSPSSSSPEDEAGELHVHSTPEQDLAYEAGTSEHEIAVDRPGVVEVENHDPDSIVLQLEVR